MNKWFHYSFGVFCLAAAAYGFMIHRWGFAFYVSSLSINSFAFSETSKCTRLGKILNIPIITLMAIGVILMVRNKEF